MTKLKDLYIQVAQHADMESLQINAADVGRVLATMFTCLADKPAGDVHFLVAHGLKKANDKMVKPFGRRKASPNRTKCFVPPARKARKF